MKAHDEKIKFNQVTEAEKDKAHATKIKEMEETNRDLNGQIAKSKSETKNQ